MKLNAFEMVFLALVGLAIAWVALQIWNMPIEAALFPWVVLTAAIGVWIMYVGSRLLRAAHRPKGDGPLMDIGFFEADTSDRQVIFQRALRFWGSVVALIVGAVLVGFQITIPLFVFIYLVVWAKVRIWAAALTAGAFLLVIVFVYGRILNVAWNDPLLWRLLRPLLGVA